MIHALIKTTRTTAFALRRHTHTHTTAEVVEVGREDWCENFVHTIPIHNDTRHTHIHAHAHTEMKHSCVYVCVWWSEAKKQLTEREIEGERVQAS